MSFQTAYFAGGCFWCITPAFERAGAAQVICGYSGGEEIDPAYEQVKKQQTGHRETIAIRYDPERLTYERLIKIFLSQVDPFDGEGQFIDRGFSYTLAIYYENHDEKQTASAAIHQLEASTGKTVHVAVEPFKSFYPAEEYHQQYYLKNPEAF